MKSARVQVCIEEALLTRLTECAKTLDVSLSYVVADIVKHNIVHVEQLCDSVKSARNTYQNLVSKTAIQTSNVTQ